MFVPGEKVEYTDKIRNYRFSGIVESIQYINNRTAPHFRAKIAIEKNPYNLITLEMCQDFLQLARKQCSTIETIL